jgi:hypothetical protein
VETGWCWWKGIVANVVQRIPVFTNLKINNELPFVSVMWNVCEVKRNCRSKLQQINVIE